VTLASAFQAAVDDVYAEMGVECTYSPASGPDQSVTATIEHNLATYGDLPSVQGASALVSVRRSEMSETPRRGETYTIGGTEYVVSSILTADELEHTAVVS